MLSGALTEWLPTFGVSWQMVQVPMNGLGNRDAVRERQLFKPATPVIMIGFVLNSSWPRTIARRARSARRAAEPASAHASNSVNALGIERRAGRIQADRIVDADEERLLRQRARTAHRAVVRGANRHGWSRACAVKSPVSKRDDRLPPPAASDARAACGVRRRRIVGLLRRGPARMVVVGRRFAAVPHDRAEERQVRRAAAAAGTSRPSVERRAAVVRIVDAVDDELGAGRDVDADADQAALEQHAEGPTPLSHGRHVRAFAVRSIVGAEHRIEPRDSVEAALDASGVIVHPWSGR